MVSPTQRTLPGRSAAGLFVLLTLVGLGMVFSNAFQHPFIEEDSTKAMPMVREAVQMVREAMTHENCNTSRSDVKEMEKKDAVGRRESPRTREMDQDHHYHRFFDDWKPQVRSTSSPIRHSTLERAAKNVREAANAAEERALYEQSYNSGNLWQAFGKSGTRYQMRNAVIAHALGLVARPRRVFEFGGNGGFAAQAALSSAEVRRQLQHWVHTDLSRVAVAYAAFLLSSANLIDNVTVDADQLYLEAVKNKAVPTAPLARIFSTSSAGEDHPVAIEVFALDTRRLSDIEQLGYRLSVFDTFVTISFEHFQFDLEIVSSIPVGKWFVFSVPNFDHHEHFRFFKDENAIRERYERLLNIPLIVTMFDNNTLTIKFVVCGQRRFGVHATP